MLRNGVWPSYPTVNLILPSAMADITKRFEAFYNRKYNSRKLTWLYSEGEVQIRAAFPKGVKILRVATLQVCGAS